MTTYLIAMAAIFGILMIGIAVDRAYRRFAARNPQCGPFRAPGCGSCKSCPEPKSKTPG